MGRWKKKVHKFKSERESAYLFFDGLRDDDMKEIKYQIENGISWWVEWFDKEPSKLFTLNLYHFLSEEF